MTASPAAPLAAASLSNAALASLDTAVAVPTYDRGALRSSIVHLGVGGFHRAHLATYIDELCRAGDQAWGIVGCGLLRGDAAMRDALEPQDTLYTLIDRGAEATRVRVIGSIIEYVLGHPNPQTVVDRIAHADAQIVSLTVTEGGYPVDDLTGEYLPDSPNTGPNSAFGIIAAALEKRRTSHGLPITVMSCDNIMTNGAVAQAATLGEARRYGVPLVEWIASSVSFPNSMVDRITPATAESDRAWLATTHSLADNWPVVTEPFRQWVVEDDFAGDRPPLEDLDIIVTDDVEPYEFMKLRLLNASHSCLAYLAALEDIESVDAAMANRAIARYVRAFLDLEATPVLPPVANINIAAYNDTLIERFSNPEVGDQISRLCLDGSAKFPKFLLPTVRAQVAAGGPVALSALALAGWCQYLIGTSNHGSPIDLAPDPLLKDAVEHAKLSADTPEAFLAFDAVFDAELAGSPALREAFRTALSLLRSQSGVPSAIDWAIHEVEGTDDRRRS